ncbi:hypothetical protein FSS13T_18500 [Flavobacterium saliperosum S13]|uniref:Uncharacterized protein n=2 Tax=Flavobacterium saliperosum TaxID=329186 RepID=A0A1G4VKC3_9FLAO|nr:hypothetical protein [Flavobacterium saliperosum]ESU25613.1 hypothetical protein FSS13T_18500 [Flavobacterium saliperosum S13]SCX08073.1 hypothetical protein SAMN02927925_01292 [Flavobacterium saliperosum]
MSKPSERFKKRKNAKELLQKISDNSLEYLIIHYSCESFYDLPEGNTPRITSIGVRYVKNAQTHSFSIHKIAELRQIAPNEINQNYNILEKAMLDEYFQFVSKHPNHKWIHINMRNINYGFEAINHRYRVLGGTPIDINDDSKIDLARLFIDLYGKEYAPHPRFESLYILNNITMSDFLNGEEEAQAFVEGNYVGLHQSTLRKIDNMHNVLSLANENDLKNKSNLFQIYGISIAGLYYMSKDNWIVAIIFWLINTSIAALIGIGITSFFSK